METNDRNGPTSVSDMVKEVKEYSKLQIDLLKLNLAEKMSLLISLFISVAVGILLFFAAFVVFSIALVHWLGTFFHSLIPGYLIVGGFFLLLLVIFFIFREKLVLNPVIRKVVSILFDNDKNRDENEE